MKKVLLIALALAFTTGAAFANYGYLTPTTEMNRNFQPLMQHKFEKEETLDFVKQPEEYKEKREHKDKLIEYKQQKIDIPPAAATQYNLQGSRPGSNNLQFVKDADGKIKIQGVR